MTQSTSFAHMANNLLNVLQGCSKSIRLLLAMFLTLIVTTNAWGAETLKTTCVGTGSGYGTRRTATYDGIGWVLASGQTGYLGANSSANHNKVKPTNADLPVVKAQDASATTSTTGYYFYYTSTAIANVTKIEFSYTDKSGSNTVNAYVVSSSTAAASGSATWSKLTLASGTGLSAQGVNIASATGTYTFKLNAKETSSKYYGIILKTSSYSRLTTGSIKIYVDNAVAHTVNWTINPAAGGTLSATSGTSTTVKPNSAYTYGSPAYTVTTGSASVVQSTNTFTATPSANCTIRINMVEKPKYTVTLVPGSGSVTNTELEEPNAGEGVTLPEPTLNCGDWEFAGWKTTSAVTTETTTEPTLIAAGKYMPSDDITLYAVYKRTEETEGTPTTENKTYTHTITAKTWSANGAQTLNSISWTLDNNGSYYGHDGTKGQQVGSSGSPAKSMTLTTSGFASATKITAVRISTSGASSINGTVSVKVGSTAYTSGGSTTKSLTSTNTQYEFTGSSTGNVTITWTQTSSKAIYFKQIEVDYQTTTGGGSTTTYYHSTPDCGSSCTPPESVTISGSWDRFGGETISLTATPNEGTGDYSYQWQKYYGSTWNNITDNATATTANLVYENCDGSHSGTYRCVVSTGADCSTASNGFQVKVYTLECYNNGTNIYHFTRIEDTQSGTLTLNLNASTAYKFQVHVDNDYYGNDGTINKDETNWELGAGLPNLTVNSGLGGTFTFTIDYSTNGNNNTLGVPEISVTYPRKTIYLNPGVWNTDDAKYAIYYFIEGHNAWSDLLVGDVCGTYTTIPQWNGVTMIAVRLNSDATGGTWDKKWNQTGNIPVNNNDYITITDWGDSDSPYTYSTYTPATYSITFNANGGTGTMTNVTGITCGGLATLIPNAFTRTGYTFAGWATTADGEVAHTDKATISNITSNITLHAKWTPNTNTAYKVKHYKQQLDGTYSATPDDTDNLTGTTAASVTPTVKSYTGFSAPSAQTVTIAADGSTVVEYQYTRNSYTLTWNLDGGTIITQGTAAGEVKYGAALTAPTVTKTGYTFAGWSPAVAATMPDEHTTYTAQWTQLHTITWMVGSDPVLTYEVANETGVTDIPSTPADNEIGNCANAFMGWSEKSAGSTPQDEAYYDDLCTAEEMKAKHTSVTGDKTFFAVFASAEGGNDYVQISSENDLVAGSKYLIVGNSSSTYRALPVDKATSLTSVNPLTSKISNPADELIWTLEGTADQWKIKSTSNNKYLQISGGNLTFVESTTLTFAVTVSSSKFTFTSSASSGNKILSYYHNGKCFNAFSSANTVYIYKQDVSYSNYVTQCCTDWTPTLTYLKTTLDASTNETETPTITGNIHSAPVLFESSNESVLTVDANNGTITAVGAGKATITATWDATGVYCGKSITTDEITVNGNFLVTFHANDGSGNTTTQQIPSNTATALKANTFQRDGYTFQGWARSASGAKEYDDGQEVTLSESGLDLYAVWKINAYQITIGTITGNGTITTSPASSANYEAQVTITATPAAHYTLTSVVVTRDDNSQTVVVGGNKFTMPASDVTITAVFTENEKFAINYAIPTGGGEVADDAPTWIYSDGSITLPGIKDGTISSEYSCEEFIGWTTLPTYENANGQKPNPFYAIGASLSGITQNTTLYAVYSRAGEGASGTVELTCTDVSTWKSDVLSGNNNPYGTVTTRSAADGSEWKTNGLIQNAGGISLKENYYIQIPTLPGPMTTITMKVSQGNLGNDDACYEYIASPTSRAFHFRSTADGSNLFTSIAVVDASRSRTIEITEGNYTTGYIINGESTSHVHAITVAYGSPNIISTSLNCSNDIDEFTITYNLNQSSVVSGTQITGVCESGVMYKFSEITEYTICSAPRANGYQLVGWNTQANGKGGLTYTPGQVITSVPLSTLTLYAQWAPVVSLSDVGNISTVNATTVGGSVTLPDGENGCDPYEFRGWTEVYPSWNETAQLPTLVANPYTPTTPITLYAVYTQHATSPDFTANCDGGVYEIWEKGTNQHMAGQRNDSYNLYTKEYWDSNKTGSNGAPFTITKIGENTYTIQNAEGHYIAKHSNDTKLEIESEWQNLDRYKWTVSAGTNGSWRFTNKEVTTHALIYYNPYFRLYSASNVTNGSTSFYDLELTPVESAVYYSAPSCGDYAIHFYTHGGEFVQGEYAFSTAVTEGLNGTVETKFPSATLNGYTFVGWKENAPQDELTDNSPEGDTSAEPYGLKKPGDDLITTTRREFHAVYYYYDELQDVDLSGPITTSIFAENNAGELRFLSGTPSDNPGTLSSTTACGDVAVVKITPGTGENTGKYTININGYNIIPQSGEAPGVERGTAWWYIEETSTGSGEYKIYVQNERNIVLNGVSFGNYAYNAQGSYNGDYHYVRFGNCREHHWASDPKRKPSIILSSSGPLTITSAAGQTIKSINKLFVGATHYETQTKIYLTCDVDGVGLLHEDGTALSSDANGEYLTTTAEGELTSTNLILTYSPTITTDGIETVTITAQDAGNQATATRLAEVRHLPENFVIAAKVGNLWYALPSQGLNSTDALVGYPIEVDNIADPTAVTAVPENADWSLRQVYASSGDLDRFKTGGHNLVFVNNVSPEKALNPSSSSNYLLTNAQYNNYHNATTPGLYEWTPTTTDLETYQLTNVSRTDKQLNIATNTVFGVHATEVVTTEVRFLPIQDRYIPAALQVVEWKENSVVIMYNGDPAQTASVSVNGGEAQTTTLSDDDAQRDIAVYELTATGLAVNPTQRLSITIGTDKVILPIPYIISGEKTDLALLPGATVAARQEVAKVADLVVLKDAKLTAAGAMGNPYKFRNATIYGGGKLVIPSEKGFGVASLTLRAGGITDAGDYDYVYPQFELRGTFTNSAAKINYDYITDYDHWYHLVLPFAGDLGTIKYPTEFYGANVAANNTGSWQIKRYAGEIRATGNYEAWVDIETEGETSTIAGKGYIFWGAPKKVSVNGGDTQRQKWGIQRITMSVTAPNAMTAENGDKAISELSSYENVPYNSGKDNDQGWNLIGNPYMVNLEDMATTGLHACKLVEVIDPATGKWNGKWEWNNETNIRYLTIPSEHFDTYTAKTVAQSVPLVAGRAFFVQLEGAANGITFAAANRASLMPALLAENNDKPVDIETGIILSNETLQDEVNFWIKDGKTNNYEYNADYPKTPNNNHFNIYGVHTNGDLSWVATSPEYAAQSMPIGYQVPAAGTFTLSVSETYYSENLQALFVTDHEASPEVTTNLVDEDYTFYVNQAETNNTRFTVSIILKPDTENTPTGVDNINTKANQPIKFLYQDKIYILRNGMIYDTTGKQVITINK